MHIWLRRGLGALTCLVIVIAALTNLGQVSFLWQDEGWTLSVARNWVERGHYGLFELGEPVGPRLAAAFPTVASLAFSFKVFGVGIWQARLPMVLYTFGALGLLYWLARRLFDRSVALLALILAVFATPDSFLNPIYLGRQVLAEMPLMFFLLLGYAAFYLALQRSAGWLAVAIGAWGWALVTKAQPLPFWLLSLIVPLALAVFGRQRRLFGLLLMGLIGALAVSRAWPEIQAWVLRDHTVSSAPLSDLYGIVAVVFTPSVRVKAVLTGVQFALPTLLGVFYAVWSWLSSQRDQQSLKARTLLRLMLLVLAASWLAWQVALSIGWTRYLFPPVFIATLFVADLLKTWTNDFNITVTLRQWREALRQRRLRGRSAGGLMLVAVLAAMLISTLRWSLAASAGDDALSEVVAYVSRWPASAVIETYDSPMFFFIPQRYHFPPGEISVPLSRRIDQGQDVAVDYDPLVAQPDVIIVGPFSRVWQLYDRVTQSGEFRLTYTNARYQVYERNR